MSIAAILLAAPSLACSQKRLERDSILVRNNCRLAEQAITTGSPGPLLDWAKSQIEFCEESGATMLSALWRSAGDDPVALAQVARASERFQDTRLLDTVTALALNASRSPNARIVAMGVLVSYHSPARLIPMRPWPSTAADAAAQCLLGDSMHFVTTSGSMPFDGTTKAKVKQTLQTLGSESGLIGDGARCALAAIKNAGG